MKFTFLGVGGMFAKTLGHTNILVEFTSGYKLLIDCGNRAPLELYQRGLYPQDINGYYISHLHDDHVGGIQELGLFAYFHPNCHFKPDLFIAQQLRGEIWNNCLMAGMSSIEGSVMSLEDYFNVVSIPPNGSFGVVKDRRDDSESSVLAIDARFDGWKLSPVQTAHFMNGRIIVPSFGLLFEKGDDKPTIFITTDTQFAPHQIQVFYEKADVIFQDCEAAPYKSGVHAHFDELVTLPEKIRRKMWFVHYPDTVLEDINTWKMKANGSGFLGFVKKGQEFEF